jgi:hypothetical protein
MLDVVAKELEARVIWRTPAAWRLSAAVRKNLRFISVGRPGATVISTQTTFSLCASSR